MQQVEIWESRELGEKLGFRGRHMGPPVRSVGAWGDQKQMVQGKIGMASTHLPIHSCQSPAAVLTKLMAITDPTPMPREAANGGGGPGPREDPSWRGKKTRRSTEPSPLLP